MVFQYETNYTIKCIPNQGLILNNYIMFQNETFLHILEIVHRMFFE